MKPRAAQFYSPLLLQTGLTLLLAGIVLLVLMWTSLLGPFHFLSSAQRSARRPIGLFVSSESRSTPGSAHELTFWQQLLPERRELIAVAALDADLGDRVESLIAPDTRVLTSEESDALQRFVAAGGGLLLIGSIGVRDSDGHWLGYNSMRRLLKVAEVAPIDPGQKPRLRAVRRGPLAAALAPAETIRLAREMGVPAIPNERAEVVWIRGEAETSKGLDGASLRRRPGRGRLLWLAAGPKSSWQALRGDWQPMVRLLRASLAWVTHEPQIEQIDWSEDPRPATRAEGSRTAASDLETSFERRGAQGLLLHVSNRTSHPRPPTALRIYLNSPLLRAEIKSTLLFEARPGLRFRHGLESLDVLLPAIEAGSSRSYALEYQTGSACSPHSPTRAPGKRPG